MKVETILLRVPSRRRLPDLVARPGDLELMATLARPAAADIVRAEEIDVEVDELTAEQARDFERLDDTVAAVAPIMPVTLVEPTGVSDAPSTDMVSWGIEAIGADQVGPAAGAGVKVAVLDTGLDRDHPAFAAISKDPAHFRNFVSDDRAFRDEVRGHGTHCAATIFGQDVDGRRIGVARGVRDVLVGKVLAPKAGSSESIFRAISWAISEGARVISMSLSLDFTGYRERLVETKGVHPIAATSIALAAYRANIRLFDRMSQITGGEPGASAGAVVVVAAGNESRRETYTVATAPPAAAEKFISVGALERKPDGTLAVASFSNSGVNLVAPGVGILSARNRGGLVAMDGTSMAAPHVAGVAVLMAEKMGDHFNAAVLRQKLLAGAALKDGAVDADVGAGLVKVPV